MVGGSILKTLQSNGFENVVAPTRSELDLFDRNKVKKFLS